REVNQPRRSEELVYMTWMPDTNRLRVHFRTKITDASLKQVRGGPGRGPFPLPPPPLPPAGRPGGAGLMFFPPPPPRDFEITVGVRFGVEVGTAYEVDKAGKLVSILDLPVRPIHEEVGGPGRPIGGPLPPARR